MTSTIATAISHARAVRAKLFFPPNSVPDSDIDLGRQGAAARAALDEIRLRERTDASYKLPPKASSRFWTDERCAELRSLWQTGACVEKIAKTIGATSRNAVTAKAHVMGLPPRNKSRPKVTPPSFELSRASDNGARGPIIKIQEMVASAFGISRNNLISHRRGSQLIGPRHIAMYLCAELTPASYPVIGRYFAGRDHSTIMHGHKKIKKLRASDPKLDADILRLIEKLSLFVVVI